MARIENSEAVKNRIAEQFIAVVAKNPSCTEVELKAAVNGKSTTKFHAIRELLETGLLVRKGTGRKNDPFRYELGEIPMEGGRA
jgi:hypothetical protein